MEQLGIIAQLAQLGATAILMVILWVLWQEFREQNKFIRDLLLQGDAERIVLASKMGLETKDLKSEAAAIRALNLHTDQRN